MITILFSMLFQFSFISGNSFYKIISANPTLTTRMGLSELGHIIDFAFFGFRILFEKI